MNVSAVWHSIQIYLDQTVDPDISDFKINSSKVKAKHFYHPNLRNAFSFHPPSPFGNNEYELAKIKSTQLEKMRDCATKS